MGDIPAATIPSEFTDTVRFVDSPIDVTFDVRSDTPPGMDPDSHSPKLRRYHQLLWSKPLPFGGTLAWDTSDTQRYLHHDSDLGVFTVTSDSIIPTYTTWIRLRPITSQIASEEIEAFRSLAYTIGGFMVWPGTPRTGARTINVERGFNAKIADRMDLTLECIRRHYQGDDNPMAATLRAYADFFDLFHDFIGFAEFFLLQDLLGRDLAAVDFLMPFDDFRAPHTPPDVAAYRAYRARTMDFLRARNARIQATLDASLTPPA